MPSKSNNLARLVVALALALLVQCAAAPYALAQDEPEVPARSWVLTDAESGEYLAGENADERLSMGSTDKIMVALVALRMVEAGEVGLDDEVIVSEGAASFAVPLYSNVGLFPGDSVSVRELLAATLIPSGNDAAYALAEHLGGGGGEAGVDRFVERMNQEAEALGLDDTRFENPTGLDARGQYSSAHDLATMARAASEYPLFRELVSTEYTTITTLDREIELVSTNELLTTYPPATGVKTGTTPGAGPSLVASAAAYDRVDLVEKGERYAKTEVPYRRGETVGLVAKESVEGLVSGDPEVRRETRIFEELPGSAKRGTPLGEIVVEVDGERVGETPLVAARGYDEASFGERAWYTASGLWN